MTATRTATRPTPVTPRLALGLTGQLLLCIGAVVLASAPWLRSFPVSVAGVSLFGAAVLSVLWGALTARWNLAIAVLLDVAGLAAFTLTVALHEPTGWHDLLDGAVHGPSQLLTFALPLVSPRTLLVGPVVLTWLAGSLAGLCVARRWFSTLPYIGILTAFGLAYAASQRAAGAASHSAQLRETLLALGVLLSVLLLRTVQVWSAGGPDAPVRGLAVGGLATVAVAVITALLVQSTVFPKRAAAPARRPTVAGSTPLSPVAFVSGL
ncbi:hypothetical protein, partial [Jatrophihabitans sp.]|uniref:hypothetical protein n=1 Tax=Jatrophihabitans sp. TaxID=1932789 RepID=UPI0030C661A7|nr:Transglutaminase superfamily protein [Jatrophihabitans sp.]